MEISRGINFLWTKPQNLEWFENWGQLAPSALNQWQSVPGKLFKTVGKHAKQPGAHASLGSEELLALNVDCYTIQKQNRTHSLARHLQPAWNIGLELKLTQASITQWKSCSYSGSILVYGYVCTGPSNFVRLLVPSNFTLSIAVMCVEKHPTTPWADGGSSLFTKSREKWNGGDVVYSNQASLRFIL